MQKFTNNDLLLYLFQETTDLQTKEISEMFPFDAQLRNEAIQMNSMMD